MKRTIIRQQKMIDKLSKAVKSRDRGAEEMPIEKDEYCPREIENLK